MIPSHLTLSPFVNMWQTIPLLTYLENSLIVCSVASVALVIIALLAAYAVSRYRFTGSRLLSITILSTQMFPGILFLLPLFVIFVNLSQVTGINLYGSRTGLIITYMTFTLPFAIWMLAAYLDAHPRELDEAATVDGTGPLGPHPGGHPGRDPGHRRGGYLRVHDRLERDALCLRAHQQLDRTLAVGLQGYAHQNQVYWNQIMAASLTVSVPIVVGFLLLQRFLVAGADGQLRRVAVRRPTLQIRRNENLSALIPTSPGRRPVACRGDGLRFRTHRTTGPTASVSQPRRWGSVLTWAGVHGRSDGGPWERRKWRIPWIDCTHQRSVLQLLRATPAVWLPRSRHVGVACCAIPDRVSSITAGR